MENVHRPSQAIQNLETRVIDGVEREVTVTYLPIADRPADYPNGGPHLRSHGFSVREKETLPSSLPTGYYNKTGPLPAGQVYPTS